MKLSTHVSLAAAVLSLFGAGSAVAADKIVLAALGDVQGKVLVNKGKGYVTAKAGMEVAPGDRVIALDNASAKVLYQDGCVTDLHENNVLAVDGKGCVTAPVRSRAEPIRLAEALGSGGTGGTGTGGTGTGTGGTGAGTGGAGAGAGGGTGLLGTGGMMFWGFSAGFAALGYHAGNTDNNNVSHQ